MKSETTIGDLQDYHSGEFIRKATEQEQIESIEAAERDGGVGVIEISGRHCYVI